MSFTEQYVIFLKKVAESLKKELQKCRSQLQAKM